MINAHSRKRHTLPPSGLALTGAACGRAEAASTVAPALTDMATGKLFTQSLYPGESAKPIIAALSGCSLSIST